MTKRLLEYVALKLDVRNGLGGVTHEKAYLTLMGVIFLAPFLLSWLVLFLGSQDPQWNNYVDVTHAGMSLYGHLDRWALLKPALVIDGVLAVAMLPFLGDIKALHQLVWRSDTFTFAWTSMLLAAAIYARLPVYVIVLMAYGLSVAFVLASRTNAAALKHSWGWVVPPLIGQTIVLFVITQATDYFGYTTDERYRSAQYSFELEALARFIVFGFLAVIGAYLASLCLLVSRVADYYKAAATNPAKALLIRYGLPTFRAYQVEAAKQKAAEIETDAEAALTALGYPAGFWRRHQDALSGPIYGVVFFGLLPVASFVGGFGIALMAPVELAAFFAQKAMGGKPAQGDQSTVQENKDGHTLV